MYTSRHFSVDETDKTYFASYVYTFDSLEKAEKFFSFLYKIISIKMKRKEEAMYHTYREDTDSAKCTAFHCNCYLKYHVEYFFMLIRKPNVDSYKIISTEKREYYTERG